MLLMRMAAFILLITILAMYSIAFGQELNGWIRGDMCWVVKTPSGDAKIIGIIKKKAHVTVEDAGDNWLKIIDTPVRNPMTGKWIECRGCYIQKINFTTQLPNKW